LSKPNRGKRYTCWAATQDFQVGEMLGQTQN